MLKDRDLIVAAFLIFRCGGGLPCGTGLLLVSLEPLDEPVGGAVVVQFHIVLGKFREDFLCQLLAEFNAPLVVTVDVPNHALYKNLMFIHGDKSTESFRGNIIHHNGIRRVELRPPP